MKKSSIFFTGIFSFKYGIFSLSCRSFTLLSPSQTHSIILVDVSFSCSKIGSLLACNMLRSWFDSSQFFRLIHYLEIFENNFCMLAELLIWLILLLALLPLLVSDPCLFINKLTDCFLMSKLKNWPFLVRQCHSKSHWYFGLLSSLQFLDFTCLNFLIRVFLVSWASFPRLSFQFHQAVFLFFSFSFPKGLLISYWPTLVPCFGSGGRQCHWRRFDYWN